MNKSTLVPREEMSDLDWLARNVHEWCEGANYICVDHTDGGHVFHEHNRNCAVWFTRDQWLARRAELQNKPSWDDFRESAKFMAQDSDGAWRAFEIEPTAQSLIWNAKRGWRGYAYEYTPDNRGEVLGDWRDTLEKRPEEFQPFTSIEDNQEKDMKQDNGWYERGDLPPVGLMCEIRLSCWNSEKYEKVTVAAITKEYLIVKYATFEQHYMLKDISFRPLCTERDKLVELIKTYRHTFRSDTEFADAILATGFSLRAK